MNFVGQSMSLQEKITYLRTLPSIRERCSKVYEKAKEGKLQYFEYHPENEAAAVDVCLGVVNKQYGAQDLASKIPPHGRWRHLDIGVPRVTELTSTWNSASPPIAPKEQARMLIDLFFVSVLLDAGAGNEWKYVEKETGQTYSRSEGLAVASYEMFEHGFFGESWRVGAAGLTKVTPEKLWEALQVSDSNPLVGLHGRSQLLNKLGESLKLKDNELYFGADGRPGNMVDFLETQVQQDAATGSKSFPLSCLWSICCDGLTTIWPDDRLKLGGENPMGDVWPCAVLADDAKEEGDDLVPFHKLTQWLTYSLIEIFDKVLGWKVIGMEDMTGLPEYRNGGLLVDTGVLKIREGTLPINPESGLPRVAPSHPAVIEWRAMTVMLLDRLAAAINKALGLEATPLTLPQILESSTWNGGRAIAKEKRPETGGPPIELESDGTVF